MNVRYTDTALREIDSIFAYVADRDAAAAGRIVMRVEQLVSRLAEFPFLGHVADEPEVRVLPLGRYPYWVFYRVGSEEVAILHVRHAARLRPA
jgi:toxin ParE1/3/4